jgi:hypothetical protein
VRSRLELAHGHTGTAAGQAGSAPEHSPTPPVIVKQAQVHVSAGGSLVNLSERGSSCHLQVSSTVVNAVGRPGSSKIEERAPGLTQAKAGQARRTKVTTRWTGLDGGTRAPAWCQRMCWKVGAALVPMAWLHQVCRPMRHGALLTARQCALGGCGRGLPVLCPAQRSYTPAAALLSPSHHHTNRTDAAITYTQFLPSSSLSLSASSALLSPTTTTRRPLLLPNNRRIPLVPSATAARTAEPTTTPSLPWLTLLTTTPTAN